MIQPNRGASSAIDGQASDAVGPARDEKSRQRGVSCEVSSQSPVPAKPPRVAVRPFVNPAPRRLGLLVAVAVVGLLGCGDTADSGGGAGTLGASGGVSTSTAAGTPTGETSSPATSDPVTGTIRNRQGDRATVTIGIGEPQPVSEVSDAAVAACRDQLVAIGSSAERSVAVPIEVGAEVTSQLGAAIRVGLSNVQAVTSEGAVEDPGYLPHSLLFWATTYRNTGPECDPPSRPGAAAHNWTADQGTPGTQLRARSWLVVSGAITGDDPTGDEVVGRLVIAPQVVLGAEPLRRYVMERSERVVRCSASDPAIGDVSYIAIDPDAARSRACS